MRNKCISAHSNRSKACLNHCHTWMIFIIAMDEPCLKILFSIISFYYYWTGGICHWICRKAEKVNLTLTCSIHLYNIQYKPFFCCLTAACFSCDQCISTVSLEGTTVLTTDSLNICFQVLDSGTFSKDSLCPREAVYQVWSIGDLYSFPYLSLMSRSRTCINANSVWSSVVNNNKSLVKEWRISVHCNTRRLWIGSRYKCWVCIYSVMQ